MTNTTYDNLSKDQGPQETRDRYSPYEEADTSHLEEAIQDADLPPSAKFVYKTLEYEGPQTQQELAEDLPQRTVREAVNRLIDCDVVSERFSFTDARKKVYSLDLDEDETV